jgi:glycerol-3-phosphate dehydrogenase (NAD(P)+)
MRVAILGAGAWGSSLAVTLARAHAVTLWTRNTGRLEAIAKTRESPYLAGIRIPDAVAFEPDALRAARASELVVVATSTQGMGPALETLAPVAGDLSLLWACKGFDPATGLLPHEIVSQVLKDCRRAGALSGPSFALEVARGLPAALTIASTDGTFAATTAAALNNPPLRIYSSTDLIGVELGGALKNVMAIAAGISDGLGLGANARAALVTRGLAEMARLGVRMGGQPETFMGLTGLGDLVLTATGDLSRNRTVGLRLAQGVALETILRELGHVAEGVQTARAALALASRHGVEMPITAAVCAVLFEGLEPMRAVGNLLARETKREGA